MSMEFGKLNFSVSFNPTSAFPLDARSYFESYADAESAAAKAVSAGSADSIYYYGQTLVVVENNKAKFYIIQPDNTLSAVEGSGGQTEVQVNKDLFETDSEGNLSLKGFDEAAIGSFFTKGENGELIWQTPIDTYTKEEIDNIVSKAVANAAHLKREIVTKLEDINAYIEDENINAEQYIFMVPTGLKEDSDKYDEYMVIPVTDEDGITTQIVEKVGSWEVDLSDYATNVYVDDQLDTKVDKVTGSRLATDDEMTKLAGIEEGAQVNIVKSVDEMHFGLDTTGLLTLKDISMTKVTGLEDALNGKVDAKDGYTLLSPDDQKKLNALVVGEEGNLEISGTVNASNVQGLDTWIANHASTVIGLSEENFNADFKEKLENLLYITSVKENELAVNQGQLEIIAVDQSKITGLEEALNSKASSDDLWTLQLSVDDLSDQMELYVKHSVYDAEIEKIWDSLTWKTIQ